MNREIKFKAYLKKEKTIALLVDKLGFDIEGNLKYVYVVTDPRGVRRIDAEDVELMQYTGLKDKNGEEIYTGHIVRANMKKANGKRVVRVEAVDTLYPYQIQWLLRWVDDVEILGNAWENPELLK